jgi:hypothetical protein
LLFSYSAYLASLHASLPYVYMEIRVEVTFSPMTFIF